MSYENLNNSLKLRVDAHIADYFRDNDRAEPHNPKNQDTFINAFRRMVLATHKRTGMPVEAAYDRVLADVRDALSVNAATLSPVKSNHIGTDQRLIRATLEIGVKSIMVAEVSAENYGDVSIYRKAVVRDLANATDDLSVVGQKSPTVPFFLHRRSTDMMEGIHRQYDPKIIQAAGRIHTSLSENLEIEAINTAVYAMNNTGWANFHLNDGGKDAASEAVRAMLKDKKIKVSDADITQLVTQAYNIAKKDGKGNDSYTGR